MRYLLLNCALLLAIHCQAEVFNVSYEQALKEQAFVEKMEKLGDRLSEQDLAILKQAKNYLLQSIQSPGLAVGEKAPAFSLKNPFGQTVKLKQLLEKGPVILVFYRGAWCPYCNLHLRVLQESLGEFQKYNGQLVTITPQQPDKSLEQFKLDARPFEVLSDLNYDVMQRYNLYFDMPKDALEVYKKIDIDLEEYNGHGRTGLPVPGTFIVDQSGIIRAVHAEADYAKRMEPATIIASLKEISQ